MWGSWIWMDCKYPLPRIPTDHYRKNASLRFGAVRKDSATGKLTRKHAGVDLPIGGGTAVFAVAAGTVCYVNKTFFKSSNGLVVQSIAINHDDAFIAHYCEVIIASGLGEGTQVEQGQRIAEVGRMQTPMLHFEMYSGVQTGALLGYANPYRRREDLIDPTNQLDAWERAVLGG